MGQGAEMNVTSPRTVAVMVICVLTVARGGGVWEDKEGKVDEKRRGEGNSTKAPKWPENCEISWQGWLSWLMDVAKGNPHR